MRDYTFKEWSDQLLVIEQQVRLRFPELKIRYDKR